jgi:hypothetical protein
VHGKNDLAGWYCAHGSSVMGFLRAGLLQGDVFPSVAMGFLRAGLRLGPCGCKGNGGRTRTGKKGDTNMWVVCAVRRQNRAPRSTLGSYRVV